MDPTPRIHPLLPPQTSRDRNRVGRILSGRITSEALDELPSLSATQLQQKHPPHKLSCFCSPTPGRLEHGGMLHRECFTGSVESEEVGPSVFSRFASWFFSAICAKMHVCEIVQKKLPRVLQKN